MDLNSDIGESFAAWRMGDDCAMLDIITSANIACGFHAGDPAGMLDTLRLTAERGVVVGAHVGYRDLAGFGRRAIDITPRDLTADVIYQLGALDGLAVTTGTQVRYVKPHGALYNTIAQGGAQADAVIAAICAYNPDLPLVVLAGAPLILQAQDAGLTVVAEAFADRAYLPDGQLVPRQSEGAVLDNPDEVASRMLRLARSGTIRAVDGSDIKLEAESICVHGDSRNAVEIARRVHAIFDAEGIALASFVKASG